MKLKEPVAALQQFALDNYDNGGHWVYETHEVEDYIQFLADAHWDLGVAMLNMQSYWQLMNTQRKECQYE